MRLLAGLLTLPFLFAADASKKLFHVATKSDKILGADIYYYQPLPSERTFKIRTVFAEKSRLTGKWDVSELAVSPARPFALSYLHLTDQGLYQDLRNNKLDFDFGNFGHIRKLRSDIDLKEAFDLVRTAEINPPEMKNDLPHHLKRYFGVEQSDEKMTLLQKCVVPKNPDYWENRTSPV